MALLLIAFPIHALIFHGPVYSKPEALDAAPTMPGIAKAAAISSLCIWIAIACCGRWIAYYEPKDKNGKPVATLEVPRSAPALTAQR
jgi:hypothetical protein